MPKFIDPTTDFGFKKLFGQKASKDITLSFINDVLELERPLTDLKFLDKEKLPDSAVKRAGSYDVFCEDGDGNSYIVEMQKSRFDFIKDRMLYYATFPIVEQAKKGWIYNYKFTTEREWTGVRDSANPTYGGKLVRATWNFELKAVFCIAVMDYPLDGSLEAVMSGHFRSDVAPYEIFYDKLMFVTLELPLFDETKPEYSLDRRRNKWLYFLKHLDKLTEIPKEFRNDPIFEKAFGLAEILNLNPHEMQLYEESMRRCWEVEATMESNFKAGVRAGIKQGRNEGKLEEAQTVLRLVFAAKLGAIPTDIQASIDAISAPEKCHGIVSELMNINDWEALLQRLQSSKK